MVIVSSTRWRLWQLHFCLKWKVCRSNKCHCRWFTPLSSFSSAGWRNSLHSSLERRVLGGVKSVIGNGDFLCVRARLPDASFSSFQCLDRQKMTSYGPVSNGCSPRLILTFSCQASTALSARWHPSTLHSCLDGSVHKIGNIWCRFSPSLCSVLPWCCLNLVRLIVAVVTHITSTTIFRQRWQEIGKTFQVLSIPAIYVGWSIFFCRTWEK